MGRRAATKKNTVKVHETTRREYETDIDDDAVEVEETTPADPLDVFFAELDATRDYKMSVWVLPNYARTGLSGRRADSIYVTAFAFSADDVESYRSTIQQCYPAGGMFYIEVRDRGAIVKSWSEQIASLPGYQAAAHQPGFPGVINIHQPQPGQTQQASSPIEVSEIMAKQAEGFLKVAEVMKKLQPDPPTIVNPAAQTPVQQTKEERPLLEKILEVYVMKAAEKGNVADIDKVINALSGANHNSAWDSLLGQVLPVVPVLVPAIVEGIQDWRAKRRGGTTVQPNGVTAPARGALEAAQQPGDPAQQPIAPDQKAWRRVVRRMLEDCADQAAIGASLNSICDLYARTESLRPMIQRLVNLPAANVIDLCAMTASSPAQAQSIVALKTQQSALNWITTLQHHTRNALQQVDAELKGEQQESEQEEPDEQTDETNETTEGETDE